MKRLASLFSLGAACFSLIFFIMGSASRCRPTINLVDGQFGINIGAIRLSSNGLTCGSIDIAHGGIHCGNIDVRSNGLGVSSQASQVLSLQVDEASAMIILKHCKLVAGQKQVGVDLENVSWVCGEDSVGLRIKSLIVVELRERAALFKSGRVACGFGTVSSLLVVPQGQKSYSQLMVVSADGSFCIVPVPVGG